MGNAALKQHFVNLLETHAPLLVKDLPYDKLLGLSVLGASVTLQRLEIQERVLETFGIFVPFEIDRACLEEVELRLSGLQLQIFARCFVLRCRLRDWDKATREMQAATLDQNWEGLPAFKTVLEVGLEKSLDLQKTISTWMEGWPNPTP
eukprot:s50_g15.t1